MGFLFCPQRLDVPFNCMQRKNKNEKYIAGKLSDNGSHGYDGSKENCGNEKKNDELLDTRDSTLDVLVLNNNKICLM